MALTSKRGAMAAYASALIAAAAIAQEPPRIDSGAQAAAKAFIAATSKSRPSQRLNGGSAAPTLGVACTIVADGAQVVAVMPRSPAEAAGLRPGALIVSVNGAPLRGLAPEAIAIALGAPTPTVTYGIAGGPQVTLIRTSPAVTRPLMSGGATPD